MHTITVNGVNHTCPNHPLAIPLTLNFTVGGTSYSTAGKRVFSMFSLAQHTAVTEKIFNNNPDVLEESLNRLLEELDDENVFVLPKITCSMDYFILCFCCNFCHSLLSVSTSVASINMICSELIIMASIVTRTVKKVKPSGIHVLTIVLFVSMFPGTVNEQSDWVSDSQVSKNDWYDIFVPIISSLSFQHTLFFYISFFDDDVKGQKRRNSMPPNHTPKRCR